VHPLELGKRTIIRPWQKTSSADSVGRIVQVDECGNGRTTFRRKRTMWKKLVFFLAVLSSIVLTACNTVQGAGKDVERGGQKIQDEAAEHKSK
jgi:predicted small secreted protein